MNWHELLSALRTNDEFALENFIKQGGDINMEYKGISSIYVFISKEEIKAIDTYLKYGGSINRPDSEDMTPLGAAVFGNKKLVITHLIKQGVDVNVYDNHEYLPLHYAAWNDNKDLVDILINAGSKIDESMFYTQNFNESTILPALYNVMYKICNNEIISGEQYESVKAICAYSKYKDMLIEGFARTYNVIDQNSVKQVLTANAIKPSKEAIAKNLKLKALKEKIAQRKNDKYHEGDDSNPNDNNNLNSKEKAFNLTFFTSKKQKRELDLSEYQNSEEEAEENDYSREDHSQSTSGDEMDVLTNAFNEF